MPKGGLTPLHGYFPLSNPQDEMILFVLFYNDHGSHAKTKPNAYGSIVMVRLVDLSRPGQSASRGHQTHQKKKKKNERGDKSVHVYFYVVAYSQEGHVVTGTSNNTYMHMYL